MATNWQNYELVLVDENSKTSEVTGEDMGFKARHVAPVSKMIHGELVWWTPYYGGYETVKVTFLGTTDDAIRLQLHNGYTFEKELKPGEEWASGWYEFGTWSHYVTIRLQEKEDLRQQ